MTQLNLFTSKSCDYCGTTALHPANPVLWHGFHDADTGQLVCPGCRPAHYLAKAKSRNTLITKGRKQTIISMTYSEVPVMAQ